MQPIANDLDDTDPLGALEVAERERWDGGLNHGEGRA